jgi:hypothetical protein
VRSTRSRQANLVSHHGAWTAHPVSGYRAGELSGYSGDRLHGSTYDEPLPVAFLDDVLATNCPVLWMYDNIWQLTARKADFQATYGFTWKQFDFSTVGEVRYNGTSLTRDTINGSGIMDHVITDPSKVTVLGEAVRADGTTLPWALRSGNITYVGEIPFAYVSHDDRYIAFADVLTGVIAPSTPTRHRALVRIEDVGPDADPASCAPSPTTCTASAFRSRWPCTAGTGTRRASRTAASPRTTRCGSARRWSTPEVHAVARRHAVDARLHAPVGRREQPVRRRERQRLRVLPGPRRRRRPGDLRRSGGR